jgi:exopolysaccharide biosynthesis protein
MRSFFRKPFAYAAVFSAVLALGFLYTLLLVFVIPRNIDQADGLPPGAAFTGVVETGWGNNASPDTGEDTASPPPTYDTPGSAPGSNPIITDRLYQDENMRIEISHIRRYDSDIYVADVRINDPSLLKTALAQDKYGMNIRERPSEMAKRVGAVLAVNGDFYGTNESGYVIRNGVIYRDTIRPSNDADSDLSYFDDLAIMRDGSFVTFDEKDFTAQEVWDKGAMHVLTFGPTLVKGGEVAVDKNTEVGLAWSGTNNPRCAIGYVSKGHYLVLVVDGRCDQSPGTSLWELAQVFCELGAETAYNLDGGGSATMIFNGKLINTPYTSWNKPSGERRVSDIVYFGYEYPRR